jgi:hypothetical protein
MQEAIRSAFSFGRRRKEAEERLLCGSSGVVIMRGELGGTYTPTELSYNLLLDGNNWGQPWVNCRQYGGHSVITQALSWLVGL